MSEWCLLNANWATVNNTDLIWTSSLNEHVVLLFLLLPNTDRLQQVEDNVRGCSTSTKYWPPSTSWKEGYFNEWVTVQTVKLVNLLKEGYFNTWVTVQTVKLVNLLKEGYFNEWINKLKIMSEAVLLLPITDRLQQVEDNVRGCSTSTKYWPPSTSWR
jgi:hypothetical protein